MSNKLIQAFLTFVIFAIGLGLAVYLIYTKPPVKKKKPPKRVPTVRVIKVSPKPYRIIVEADGVVRTVKKISLIPQVAGKVVYLSPNFQEGGKFQKGELLIALEDKDYRLALKIAQAEVESAESQLLQLEAEAQRSIEEWKSFRPEEKPPILVSKKPQLRAAKARLSAAKAQLEKAKLNLKRTQIYAPFSGKVLEKKIDVGQYVAPGQILGIIYATNEMEAIVHILPEKLKWVHKNSPAEILDNLTNHKWYGRVWGVGGKIDETTRLVPIIIKFKSNKQAPLPGTYVKVKIKGPKLHSVVVLPLTVIHKETGKPIVWIVDKHEKLRFRKVKVIYENNDLAVITRGLKAGDRVIISPLSIVTDGMKVRIAQ